MPTGETENSLRLKVTWPFLMLIVSMRPEMCEFCNEIALTGVSGSFRKLILASKLKFVLIFNRNFLALPTDETLAIE